MVFWIFKVTLKFLRQLANISQMAEITPPSIADSAPTSISHKGHDVDIPSNEGYVIPLGRTGDDPSSSALTRQESAQSDQPNDEKKELGTDVENGTSAGETNDADDSNIVWWDGPDDPQNPMNFPSWLRNVNLGLVSGICFVTPLASSMFAPGVPKLMEEFNSNNVPLAGFVVSVYVLGFAIGPLILAPLSETYGRLPVYHICNVLFLIFTIACALATNITSLIVFRFFAGMWGGAPLTMSTICLPSSIQKFGS